MNSKVSIKKLVTIAMLSALAYLSMFLTRSLPPIVTFPPLKYDPKDVIIIIGGFLCGPFAAAAMSVIVSLVEMLTVSTTGPIGLVMNIVSSCAFAFTASAIYRKKRTIRGAVAGLVAGLVTMVCVMMLWNYLITPIYTGAPREAVAKMLIPTFLPFNLFKGGLNLGLTLLIYKPLATALRKTGMLPKTEEGGKVNIGIILAALFGVITFVLLMLVFAGVI